MQIKRYEAEDMAEALRMVKREFGDHAVILSAKEVRPGGFFSALRPKRVEITAAADHSAADSPADNHPAQKEFSGMLATHMEAEPPADRVTLSSPPQVIEPCSQKTDLVAKPFYRDATGQKVIALVGAPGVGKSTTLAKLARHCLVVEEKSIAVISLDRFRIAGNAILESVACIMNFPMTIVHDADQMHSVLTDLKDVEVVLIDTPGLSNMDPLMITDVCALLRLASPDETHLVLNATLRDDVLGAIVETFEPTGADHMLFTHMDEYGNSDTVLHLLKKNRLPSAFYGDGVDLFDHLQETTSKKLAGYCPSYETVREQLTVFSNTRGGSQLASISEDIPGNSIHYVANRNSELFHHPACKSVKRINAQNITAFDSIEQAMQVGFKPCRACCDSATIRKSVPAAVGHQRVSAI